MKPCECGCGEMVKRRFKWGHHLRGRPSTRPYKNVSYDGRPVAEHVMVAEKAIGRRLPRGAHVHHVDGDRRNNINRNLVICQDAEYHQLLHQRTVVVMAGGDPNAELLCRRCDRCKPFAIFSRATRKANSGRTNWCKPCAAEAYQRWAARQRGGSVYGPRDAALIGGEPSL